MSRETFCKRVTANAHDISVRLKELRSRKTALQSPIAALEREKLSNQASMNVYPSPRSRTGRRSRPSGSDTVGLINQEMDRRARELTIENQIQRNQKEADSLEPQLSHYRALLKEAQKDFAQMQCHNLGFSHAIMNLH